MVHSFLLSLSLFCLFADNGEEVGWSGSMSQTGGNSNSLHWFTLFCLHFHFFVSTFTFHLFANNGEEDGWSGSSRSQTGGNRDSAGEF